jgi:hypothetical protein
VRQDVGHIGQKGRLDAVLVEKGGRDRGRQHTRVRTKEGGDDGHCGGGLILSPCLCCVGVCVVYATFRVTWNPSWTPEIAMATALTWLNNRYTPSYHHTQAQRQAQHSDR